MAWAHDIYCELLAYLQHSEQGKQGSARGAVATQRGKIYPRPSRQTVDAIRDKCASAVDPGLALNDHFTQRDWINVPKNAEMTTRSPTDPHTRRDGQYTQYRHASFSGTHYTTPLKGDTASPADVKQRASQGLEILTTLCDESNWSWIDGMLLGGCLAYGLEKYDQALRWFSKILCLDPK